ncbi:LOW QUALITY PROTEIN: dynein axonemal heavy chain 11 [Erpetoichthys calabaricus]|uniref:LOW QUALITY PROTEIN: dynein axonemal heavy chain 11 n=1 Tax=Erpetoichthys calabaricus TaxID=27687 RepID=UPI002233F67C|nr:LOW QUALITY PROTEIN: dynein axonemal heavy chain 11 [Erpetoichthys calabaricus]
MAEDDEVEVPSFMDDERVRFVGSRLCQCLKVREDRWEKYITVEENQKVLSDFLEKDCYDRLFFYVSPAGTLTAAEEMLYNLKSKAVYVTKQNAEVILADNYKKALVFGELSALPLEQVTNAIEKVLVPVLFSQNNHRKWPLFISQDVTRHVENLKNKVAVVKGQYSGRTVLPIPTVTSKIEDAQNEYICKQDYSYTTVVHAIETMVISWTHQIRDLLKTDSAQPLLEGLNPNPKTELEFWKERKENMIYISNQLNSPIVQKMVRILAVSDSTYYPTFKEIFQDVSDALIEAQNIELHLRPLQKYIDLLLEEEFSKITDYFTPLFHVICLIWTHSKFYSIPARIVVLLQEFCNLLIDQAMVYLSPEDLLKGEAEEMLEKVQIAVATFTAFKESFLKHREKLPSYALSGEQFRPWDFHSQMVFARFNRFLGRLIEVQDLFCNILEFQKLEKLEFGGIKGRNLSEQVQLINNEFMDCCKIFRDHIYDPLDYNCQEFENDYHCFKEKIADFERRLGTIIFIAFTDCCGWESAFKLIAVCNFFLERPAVKEVFDPCYPTLLLMVDEELDNCKQLYDSHIQQMEKGMGILNKNMPVASGCLKWIKELKERIERPWSTLTFIHHGSVEGADARTVYQRYLEMLSLLDCYEDKVFSVWSSGMDEICELNLDQPLLRRDVSSGLLSVNFDPKLAAVLREVKYLKILSHKSIPEAALQVFEKRERFVKYIGNLELLVTWYNKLKLTTLEVEYPLIRDKLKDIDNQLQVAEDKLTWQDDSCWDYIINMKDTVHSLEREVQKTKDNVEDIQAIMKSWSDQALFCRKDNKKDGLLYMEDKQEKVQKRYRSIQEDGKRIQKLVEENLNLFKADSLSESWKAYLEFMDEMVVDGFFSAILCSLDFFIENTDDFLRLSPLFEAQMSLNAPEIIFKPSLDKEAGDGFYDVIEELLSDIYKMSAQMERLADHLGVSTYQHDMDSMLDLQDLRQEILDRVTSVINKAKECKSSFDIYAYLWVDDRAEFMKQFLLYGHVLTTEEIEAAGEEVLPENPPSIEQFKEQIDIFESLYARISKLGDTKVFDNWFRVDIRQFKTSLLNTIKKWSWMFKEHLMSYVIDSLKELEDFIKEADAVLLTPVKEGDYKALVKTMGYLLAVKDHQASTDDLFEPLKQTISLLQAYDQNMPDQVYMQMEELPEKWNNTKKIAVSVKHEVAPLQTAEVSLIRKKCVAFEVKQVQFRERFHMEAPFNYNADKPYFLLAKGNEEITILEEQMSELQDACNLFEVSVPDCRHLKQCRKEIYLLKELWDIIVFVRTNIEDWTKTKWRKINVEQLDVELRRFAKEIRTLDKEVRSWDAYTGLDSTVKNMLTSLRAVTELQNPAIRERHWQQLMIATNVRFSMSEDATLEDLLALQLHKVEDEVRNIVEKAVKEMGIEKVLKEISQTWTTMEFSYEEHYRTRILLLKPDEELVEILEDNQVQLQSILQSKYVEYFIEQVSSWQKKLTVADAVIFIWVEVQRTWSHLESIFIGSDDIRKQLPEDANRFDGIDVDFKELMFESAKTKNVIEATNKPYLHERLEDIQSRLSICEKALAEYLETKRLAFPRFYFVSSADLLDILSKGAQPQEVARHLAKLFDNMADLQFKENEKKEMMTTAFGMYSKEKEFVSFHLDCRCIGQVETWLNHLEETMRETVRRHITEAVGAYEEKPRDQWVFDYPAQVALTSSQIWWTTDVGIAFERLEEGFETALKDYNKKQIAQLNALINLLLGELSPGDRQKIMTICTIDVHARDVVAKLVAQKVTNSQAFVWLSQLRHRWDDAEKHCFANICDAQFQYSYEYLGNTSRLVITPLTDRCYITLTQSLHLIMSGAPAGPAGTGKTETTKDLGRALGVMVYVFNCSEQMDYKSIGNIYKGLAQTGAWGCFDEFNRISVEVLSVVAVQVKTIQDAIKNKKKRFLFLGEEIMLKFSVGIFITMNPGYAGRTELPENLKALFRPCAMVVPDIELICEIMLVAEGFLDARHLARKFITLYTLCKELLSKQDHYDWGLRAVKSVLVVAGSLKRGDKGRPEDQVLMRALRDFNLPKIISDDVPIFMGLIGDLFPALDVPRKRNMELEQMVRQSILDLRLQPEENFILKVVQLEELLTVRHSVFVVGNAGTGKSQILKTLNKTYFNLRRKAVWNDLNPKAVTTDELFGFIHPATREWKDGLLSCLMRDQANILHDGPKWIVLDGDIDPMWIESLNTVMDDNKVLTLASNERIPLTPTMRLVFEISHLRTATPATVSRAGILYVNPQDLGWNPYVASWIDTRSQQSEKANLTILFDKYVPPCLEQLRCNFKTITPIPESSMVQTLCFLLDCLLTPENVPSDSPRELYELYFVFACIWAFGGSVYQDHLIDYRVEFSKWWLKEMKTVKIPAQGTVFDYYLDSKTRKFLHWNDKVPVFDMEPDIPLQGVFVHTSETTCHRFFMDLLLDKGKPVMLVGSAGVGKTALVTDKIAELSDDYIVSKVPFNYYTTSSMLQKVLEKPLEKKAGRNYGPPGNKKLIYFVDDLNMPAVDTYGTVQPHTLIRQHLDCKHWYDRQKLSLKEIHNCQYVACMNPAAGSFTINTRLQRHFSVFAVNIPSADALDTIYGNILSFHFKQHPFNPAVIKSGSIVVQAAIWLSQKMVQNFLPTAIKFHYIFNLRDLSNIFQGILFSTPDSIKLTTDLVQLWQHESSRVYADKLVETKDYTLFQKLLLDTAHKYFEGVEDHILLQQPLIYCHFANGSGDSRYMPVKGWDVLKKILTETLYSYNELNAEMNLVLFEDAMQHVCRISRILESSRGYALLIGVGGSGKQSLSRLAAYISSLDVFQIILRKGYGIQDLRVDLANLYIKTGAKNMPTVFLLTDAQVPDERFLVLINDLLASGEIPELFNDEETENIITGIRNEVRSLGLLDNRENCWKFFIDRVRRQLKVILCFSPVGSTLRVRARRFPAIVNCTSIDWFHEWPQEALQSVSRRFIEEIEGLVPTVQESISVFMAYVHSSVNQASEKYCQNEKRYNYTTPKSFLEQIDLYKSLLRKKRRELSQRMERLVSGIQKLKTTASQVEDLKSKLSSQEVELNLKNQHAETLIAVIGQQTEKVSHQKFVADAEEQKIAAMQAEISMKQKECENDLARAEPALVSATAALNTLNKVNLTELKSFPNPPVAVTNVTAAVMVLLASRGKISKDRSWKAAKVFMGKVDDFLEMLIRYDKEHIHENCLKVIKEEYLTNPEFNPDRVRTKSSAAAGLCAWVINIVKYYEVFCEVEPKRVALSKANEDLTTATVKLESIRKKLLSLDTNLQRLTTQFEEATAEKVHCQEEVTRTNKTIKLANRLVKGLESENIRWAQAVTFFEAQEKTLCGDVLLAAAFISYIGSFTRHYRQELVEGMWLPFLKSQKVPIPLTEDLDPISLLTDGATVAEWNNEGLPSDRMSTENATILTNCERWPLIIDPQQQGIKWIKNKYKNDLTIVRIGQKGYLDIIERALASGDVVVLENLEEAVDPVLDPLLGRNTVKKGRYIRIGDKECEFNKGFRLILHTKMANPHYKPEMQAQTTLINFTVTQEGLEDQLLAEVVSSERPDLEKNKSDLTKQQNDFKIELKRLEDELLTRLSAAEGNFLGDTVLVENLETTKQTAAEIEHKVIEAKENEIKINEARELYRPAAQRASVLYFIINDLSKINPMYQFSLKAFNKVFHKAIERAEKSEEVKDRVVNLTDCISYSVFLYTSRGLFERDKLTFLSQTAFQILLRNNAMDPQELDFLLRFPIENNSKSPLEFLSSQSWSAIKTMSTLDEFRGLDKDIEGSAKRWKKLVESECPEKEKFPQEWKNKSSLQKLIILRAIRPDRMTYAVRHYVEENMGSKYVEGVQMDFIKSYEESSPATPIFFILSPGGNPLKHVESLGKKMGFTIDSGKLYNVSLGQGQETVAEESLEKASREGHWVILQNIHLVAKWLGTLEKLLDHYSENSHADFRVFISAEPAGTPEEHIIPQGILQNSIKITNEPPSGMLANLHSALYNFDQDTLEMCAREQEFKSILFSLCYFHACVAERRKFGPQGWNRSYPFNTGDLTISVNVLYNYLEANTKVPWEDLCYLFGEIMYGGHITDDWDRRLCNTYLQEFMQPNLLDGELFLAPGFVAPPNLDYPGYHKYIEDYLPTESPALYGLHANAEIEFLTVTSDNLFRTLLELQPHNLTVGEGSTQTAEEKVKNALDEILEKLPEEFNMQEIVQKTTERSPYILVCFQECERMNLLLQEIRRSLRELDLGLKGELTISSEMEALQSALYYDSVPESWIKLAYPSIYPLAQWFNDLLLRCRELDTWTQDLTLPAVVWLSGLFNPQSFLTAIMQSMARKNEWPLDKMCLTVDVTKKSKDDYGHPPREGAYIHGLYMEGARWDIQNGVITEARLKDLTPAVPVIFVRAIPLDRQELKNMYECPVYSTKSRGSNYIWTFNLKTKEKPAKWILAGVALLLSV